jgi:hypothetical protein
MLKINNIQQVRSKSITFIRYTQNQKHSSGTLKVNYIQQVRSKSITLIVRYAQNDVIDFERTWWMLLILSVPDEGFWFWVYLMNVIDFERTWWILLILNVPDEHSSGTLKINNIHQVRSKSITFIRYAQNQ